MRKVLRGLVITFAIGIAVGSAAFGLLQTPRGKALVAAKIARLASGPDAIWAIEGLDGTVPTAMVVRRITISDADGVWAELTNVQLDIDLIALFTGEFHVRVLRAEEVSKARPAAGPSPSLAEWLRVPHLPLALVIDRLAIDRLVLGRPVLGTKISAAVAGQAALRGTTALIRLDIHRIDAQPGDIALRLKLAGPEPRLQLQLHASDPTGVLNDGLLARSDHLPMALSVEGDGAVSDWRGRLVASAGQQARIKADLRIGISAETSIGVSAQAAVARLFPPDMAGLVGDDVRLSLHAAIGENIRLDRLFLAAACVTLTGDGAFGGPDEAVSGHLRADLPDLMKTTGLAGGDLRGSAQIVAEITGSQSRPVVAARFSADKVEAYGIGARSLAARLTLAPTDTLYAPQTRFALGAEGRLAGISFPKSSLLERFFGENASWSLAATLDSRALAAELSQLSVRAGGIDLRGSGHLTAATGFSGAIDLTGSGAGLRTGVAPVDVLLGPTPSFSGTIRRDAAGTLAIDNLKLIGGEATLAGDAQFTPASRRLSAALALDVPRLERLRAALGTGISGSLNAKAAAEGPLDRLRLTGQLNGLRIALGGTAIDALQASVTLADMANPKAAVAGSFRANRLTGRFGWTATPIGSTGLAIDDLQLVAAESTLNGYLRVDLTGGLARGSVAGHFPDLSRWSALAGAPLTGNLDLTAGLTPAGGAQGLDLDLKGVRLGFGGNADRLEVARIAATARLTDLWRRPGGTGRLTLSRLRSGALEFGDAAMAFASPAPGRFAFQGKAAGRPLSFAVAGEGGLAPGGISLRINRLTGSLGNRAFGIERQVELTRRGSDLALSGLALRLGSGRIEARFARRGEMITAAVNGADLPLAAAGQLTGHPHLHGNLSVAATLGGSLRAPQAQFTINAAGLGSGTVRQVQSPPLGLVANGDWNGRTVDLRGRVIGLHGDYITLTGSVPLLLNATPLAISVPQQGRLAVNLQGDGDIGDLSDLLPLNEDRLTGQFSVNASIAGTIAAPAAGGRLRLSRGHYENFASGAVFTDLDAELVGNGERFTLVSLTASDGAGGSLKARGSLALSGISGPSTELSAILSHFRIAARDEAVATASGSVSVAGPLSAPKVTAPLTIDKADIELPSSLPPNVVVLKVTERNGQPTTPPQPDGAIMSLPAALDITLGLQGPVLVQGRGLESQWSGRLKITGTTTAPKISGSLRATRGSYALLGKTFRLTRGTISFDGGDKLDPGIDIVAEASASDITAQVVITGYASAPTISLSSTPLLPRDEILARILFGSGLKQITAGQGLELAQAAAALSGKDSGLLDRLRGGLGLDWLRLGQGPAAAASSVLNPSVVTPTTQSATALSAGKYIAPGVSIGVTQGVSPPTSKVTVEVDLGHHLTIDTEAGQNSGSGVGINYNYDY